MPPTKKFPKTLKIAFTHCELAALDFLRKAKGQSASDAIREAVQICAQQHPQFFPERFKTQVHRDILSAVTEPDIRSFILGQLEAFTSPKEEDAPVSQREDSFYFTIPDFDAGAHFAEEAKEEE